MAITQKVQRPPGRHAVFLNSWLFRAIPARTVSDSEDSTAKDAYARLGASSSKSGVLKAVGAFGNAEYFCDPLPDPFGDENKAFFLHADGAGTKVIIAYVLARMSGNAEHYRSLATDSLVMNLDDLACTGAIEGLVLCNTIGRNFNKVGDDAIAQIVAGYHECASALRLHGVDVAISGGETADLGDLVRTLIVDSTMTARVARHSLLSTRNIVPGDAIVGFSSTGQAVFESVPNSGIGSNGLTLARHCLMHRWYAEEFPEICDPAVSKADAYRGPFKLSDALPGTEMTVGAALLSPTRSYSPILKKLMGVLGSDLHAAIHCTGGGQAKVKRFGHGVQFIKDNLFDVPPIFSAIQQFGNVPWREMYTVFNMGHRVEVMVPEAVVSKVIETAMSYGVEARKVGRVVSPKGDAAVIIDSPYGAFEYR